MFLDPKKENFMISPKLRHILRDIQRKVDKKNVHTSYIDLNKSVNKSFTKFKRKKKISKNRHDMFRALL